MINQKLSAISMQNEANERGKSSTTALEASEEIEGIKASSASISYKAFLDPNVGVRLSVRKYNNPRNPAEGEQL